MKKFLIFGLLFLFFGGCSQNAPTQLQYREQTLMPLKEGNQWNYFSYSLSPGNLKSAAREFHWQIVEPVIIDGEQYYRSFFTREGAEAPVSVIRNRTTGLFIAFYDSTSQNFTAPLLFKYPAREGEIYFFGKEIAVSSATVEVPAGTFNCLAYRMQEGTFRITYYFAPGVGMVRSKMEYPDPQSGEMVTEFSDLVTYRILP